MSTIFKPPRARYPLVALALALSLAAAALALTSGATAQSPVDEVRPAPPSIGADVPLTYFAPAPSTDEPGLIGPLQLLRSGPVDLDAGTITLPLYEGRLGNGKKKKKKHAGRGKKAGKKAGAKGARIARVAKNNGRPKIWYVLTDTSDREEAKALGILFSAKLKYAEFSARKARLASDRALVFRRGTVDFSPERRGEAG